MGQMLSLPFEVLQHTSTFYRGFFYYLTGPGRTAPYTTSPSFLGGKDDAHDDDDSKNARPFFSQTRLFRQHARIHLYSLASNFYLYDKPHYRKGSYRDDLMDNLRNVAIPGTGWKLSYMAASRWWTALPFILTAYPTLSLIAAVHNCLRNGGGSIAEEYARRLLAPDDWFQYWRLNCNIVGLHALLNDFPSDYQMENKWTFLQEGDKRGVPVSPFMKQPSAIVVKHRNEEGGLGIHFFQNAAQGGDWILQARIDNSNWVSSLLPPGAPLSTFRVITCSKYGFLSQQEQLAKRDNKTSYCKALSCVFRAGRAGAATDHDSILFDVDVKTGNILGGTTNAHWYQLGLVRALTRCPWRSVDHFYTTHPDGDDIPVAGNVVPDMAGMLQLAEKAHADLCPAVPLAGWDVVLSADSNLPVCLLEVNLSCNFFRGSFDYAYYLQFVEGGFQQLQELRLQADAEQKQFVVPAVKDKQA